MIGSHEKPCRKCGECNGLEGERKTDDFAAFETIDGMACEKRKKKIGKELSEADVGEAERVVSDIVDVPAESDVEHLGGEFVGDTDEKIAKDGGMSAEEVNWGTGHLVELE